MRRPGLKALSGGGMERKGGEEKLMMFFVSKKPEMYNVVCEQFCCCEIAWSMLD